ncbi:MAG: amidohydrolase family protein [Bacillota bacterium]
MDFDLVVQGGRVYGPRDWGEIDLGVRAGRVAALGQLGRFRAGKVVDARGLLVLPGLIDPHTHIAMPLASGIATCDDWYTGTVAAACGGITTVSDFAQARPGQSLAESLQERRTQAGGRAVVDYAFSATITSPDPDTLAEVPALAGGGVRSFKLYTVNPGLMVDDRGLLASLGAIGRTGALATVHAESAAVVEAMTARVREAHGGAARFPHTRPALAEGEAVYRVLTLARLGGAPVCIRHLSSREGLAAVIAARREQGALRRRGGSGRVAWVETAPHYLALDDSVYAREDGHRFICSPPLRTLEDQHALWRGIAAGQVDFLGTDHCALSAAQKDAAPHFLRVPGGLPGFATFLPLTYTLGVVGGHIDIPRLAELTSTAAAGAFRLYPRKGTLLPGADADLVLVDPCARQKVGIAGSGPALGWSPYEGWELQGWPRMVISRGEVIVEEGEFCGRPGRGLYLDVPAA